MLFTGKSVEQPPCSGRSLLQAAPCALHICSQIDMFLQLLLKPIEPLENQKGTQSDPENLLHLPKDPERFETLSLECRAPDLTDWPIDSQLRNNKKV